MKILKVLFVPNNKRKGKQGKLCSFPTTICSVVRLVCNRFLLTDVSFREAFSVSAQKNEALFNWYVLVSSHGQFESLGNSFHEDFDYTEIDGMVRIEICLSNDSKALFVSNNRGKRCSFL